jgi:hypothetical protein
VDPQFWNARHLHGIASPSSCLVAESAVYPTVLRECLSGPASYTFNRGLLCQSLFPLGRFIEDRTDPKGALGAGGSVATTAWDFARLLGPGEIWIAGLDLSFPGLKTHFRGALFEENAHAESGRFAPAETLSFLALHGAMPFPASSAGGGTVLTDRKLSLYAAWFENRFSQEKIKNFSLSGEGLAIKGLIPAKIGNLLAFPPRRKEINSLLNAVWTKTDKEFSAPKEKTEREKRYSEALHDLLAGLTAIRDIADSAEKDVRKALRLPSQNQAEQAKILKKLDAANAAIAESPVKEAAGFLFPPVSELEERQATSPPQSERSCLHKGESPFLSHLEFSALFYSGLAEAADFTLKTLKKSSAETDNRITGSQ